MLISPTAAAEEAKRGLNVVRLDDSDAAAARQSGSAGEPLLVARLDVPEADYYLVPWQDSRGISIVVTVEASSGKMSSVAILPTPLRELVMAPEQAKRTVEDQLGEGVIDEPRLVWQPSRESASLLQPLYHMHVKSGEAFVDSAGSVHRSLTPFGKGG